MKNINKMILTIIVLFLCSNIIQATECNEKSLPKNIVILDPYPLCQSRGMDTIKTLEDLYKSNSFMICPLTENGSGLDTLYQLLKDEDNLGLILDCSNLDSISVFFDLFKDLPVGNLAIYNYNYIDTNFKSLAKFTRMEGLEIYYSLINKFPIEICELDSLRYIYIRSNQITDIPKEIMNMKNLKSVTFCNNKINKIAAEFVKISLLYDIIFIEEPLINYEELFNTLYDIKHEFGLRIENCNLQTISPKLLKLKNLNDLDLSNNRITNIPEEISNLENLIYLHLDDNKIDKLPDSMCKLDKLKSLSLYGNLNIGIPTCLKEKKGLNISK